MGRRLGLGVWDSLECGEGPLSRSRQLPRRGSSYWTFPVGGGGGGVFLID